VEKFGFEFGVGVKESENGGDGKVSLVEYTVSQKHPRLSLAVAWPNTVRF